MSNEGENRFSTLFDLRAFVVASIEKQVHLNFSFLTNCNNDAQWSKFSFVLKSSKSPKKVGKMARERQLKGLKLHQKGTLKYKNV